MSTLSRMKLDHRADLVCDVISDRPGEVVRADKAGQIDRNEWRDLIGRASQIDTGHQVNIEGGKGCRTQIRLGSDARSIRSQRHLPARPQSEPKEVAQINGRTVVQGLLGIGQVSVSAIEVYVERVPCKSTQARKHGGRALQHPVVWLR